MEFLKKMLKTEGVSYLIGGVLTTVVNFVIFTLVNELCKRNGIDDTLSYKLAYVLAFVVAVLFAYWTNKFFVFKNHNMNPSYLLREFSGFCTARIVSGVVTFLLMVLFVDFMKWNEYLAWLLTTVFNLVFNYVASKFWIFKET